MACDWREAGLRYFRQSHFFRRRFGHRVHKVSVDAGFDCPNRDGTLGQGGCLFCNPASFSPSRRREAGPISHQIRTAAGLLRERFRAERFIAYFQPATNTYSPVARLRAVFVEALAQPDVVGLAVGTRPDCVSDEAIDLLAELARRTWVSLELGLQSIHERSLRWLRRGHGYEGFAELVGRCRERGVYVGAHVILGLPGESADDMNATADELARLRVDSVKLHQLYAVRETPLAEMVAAGQVTLLEQDQYVAHVVDFLERLPAECVIERLCGDAPAEYLVAPAWSADKRAVVAAVEAEFARRDTWQGKALADRKETS
ncbi:MAG: TIGR01212 family radical SAM protein [Pirellulales bacterium]|nr:TIGR01212 family radical SAM protein [Pirellulales bacterium]